MRRLAYGRRKPLGPYIQRKSLPERGKHFAYKLSKFFQPIVAALRKLMSLATRKLRISFGPQHVVPPEPRCPEKTPSHQDSGKGGSQNPWGASSTRTHGSTGMVETWTGLPSSTIRSTRERAPKIRSTSPCSITPLIFPRSAFLDGEVFRRCCEARATRSPGRNGFQGGCYGVELFAVGNAALEEETLGSASKSVLNGKRFALPRRALAAGDDRCRYVLAGVEGTAAITLPFFVLGEESNGEGKGRARHRNPPLDFIVRYPINCYGAVAGKCDTFRPGLGRTTAAKDREEVFHLSFLVTARMIGTGCIFLHVG